MSLTHELLQDLKLNTVCDSALCPNLTECYSKKTATFMIMGDVCTRNCRFCAVSNGKPSSLYPDEPRRVAQATARLGLKHVVVTSVTRDDLIDGGASHFVEVIKNIREYCPQSIIEVLTPDFKGSFDRVAQVVEAKPHIFNHNIETVPRLYSAVRPQADYLRSLNVLEHAKKTDQGVFTKCGIMLGLGEEEREVVNVMKDLRNIGCDIITIGQYLQPSPQHLPVKEYVHPDVFNKYESIAIEQGFLHVASGPFVRSSFNAIEFSEKVFAINS
ncbi:Lipoate synthase [Desulfosporosinus metallidurans]|uniref:Lipoyl synthase n=2 Tax=Desulfosporosinus metallidurans TaxID=1888891 RepID=A0A1Q8QZD7_9FIRM|nr:Lipoate synthase [Desulfosporosinus metallidurans]